MSRRVVQFSCGAASAVAARLTLTKHADAVVINAFIKEEHDDNQRFLGDIEKWLGVPIVQLRDEKYGASAYEVFRRVRFLRSRNGAPCSGRLKRALLAAWSQPGDIPVLGYTADEQERADNFLDHNHGIGEFPLIDAGLSKEDCLGVIEGVGIRLPEMYLRGYNNANCIGCVKGGEGYWNKIRRDFPDRFEEMARLEDEIGPTAYLFRNRKTGERFSLRQLHPDAGRHSSILPECGFACQAVMDEMGDQTA